MCCNSKDKKDKGCIRFHPALVSHSLKQLTWLVDWYSEWKFSVTVAYLINRESNTAAVKEYRVLQAASPPMWVLLNHKLAHLSVCLPVCQYICLSFTHSRTPSTTHGLTHPLPWLLTYHTTHLPNRTPDYCLTFSPNHSLIHSFRYPLTHSLTHSHT